MPEDDREPNDKGVFSIVAIGEILWDVFPTGPRFGGAPANFACTAAGLARGNGNVALVSAVGVDERGTEALAVLGQHGVDTKAIQRNEFSTGEVLIELDVDGVASYRFAENGAWDNIVWRDSLEEVARAADVVCYGTLGQRSGISAATIRRFVGSTRDECLRIFDINLRPPFYSDAVILESLKLANVLKLNEEELPILCQLLGLDGDDVRMLPVIAEQAGLDVIAFTSGADGAAIYTSGELHRSAGVATDVVDTVGAGDAFTASMVLGMLQKKPIEQVICEACEVAAFVCSEAGATPVIPSRLLG